MSKSAGPVFSPTEVNLTKKLSTTMVKLGIRSFIIPTSDMYSFSRRRIRSRRDVIREIESVPKGGITSDDVIAIIVLLMIASFLFSR